MSEGERSGRRSAGGRARWVALGLAAVFAACRGPVVKNDAHELYEPAEHGRDGFVHVLGLNLHYVEAGPTGPAAQASPVPIVLIPGAFSTYRVWNLVLPLLAERHRVFALDYIGTGDSDKPQEDFDYTVGEEADVVAAFVRALALEKPLLAGVSYGASMALNVAARYPDLPSRIVCIEGGVLIAPEVLKYGRSKEILGIPLLGDMLLGCARTGAFRESIAKSVMAGAWDGLTSDERERIIAIQSSYLKTAARPAMYDVYRAITGTIDFTAEMERETAPIVYLYGEASRYRDVAEANIAWFRERRCNVETVLLKDGIHDLQLQYPRAVAEIILEDARRVGDAAPPPRPEGRVAIASVPCVRGPNFAAVSRGGRAGLHALRTLAPPAIDVDLRPIPYLAPEE